MIIKNVKESKDLIFIIDVNINSNSISLISDPLKAFLNNDNTSTTTYIIEDKDILKENDRLISDDMRSHSRYKYMNIKNNKYLIC
jgi:hypothetical protein